jgi:hypothetical protein
MMRILEAFRSCRTPRLTAGRLAVEKAAGALHPPQGVGVRWDADLEEGGVTLQARIKGEKDLSALRGWLNDEGQKGFFEALLKKTE